MTFKIQDMAELFPPGARIGLVKTNSTLLNCTVQRYVGDKVVILDDDGQEQFEYPHNIKYVIHKEVLHIAVQRD